MSASASPAFVSLVLHAHLSRYAEGMSRVELGFRTGATIADYAKELGIPAHEFYAVVRGGVVTRNTSEVPEAGDVLELLPVISGG